MSKAPRVEVEWYDIEDDPRWQTVADAAKSECPLCYTCGRLLAVRDDALVIAPTVNSDDCSRTTIPRGCVKAIYLLRRAGKHKEQ